MRFFGIMAAAVLMAVAVPSTAHDLGTYGEVFEIEEQDLFQRLAFEMSGIDFKEQAKAKTERAEAWFESAPKKVHLNHAKKTRSFLIRHQLVVTSDLKAPVFVDNQTGAMVQSPTRNISEYHVEQRYLARRGEVHKVTDNPTYNLTERFLVFNPDNTSERAFAMAAAKADQSLVLVTTHGDIISLSKESGKPVHMLFASLQDIFKIERTPSLMGMTVHKGEKLLAVTEIGTEDRSPEDAVSFVRRNWSGPKVSDEVEIKVVSQDIDPQQLMKQFGAPQ